jgi:hypothetical protein
MENMENVVVKFEKINEKYIKDGKVAVLLTRSYHVSILEEHRCNPVLIDLFLKKQYNEDLKKYVSAGRDTPWFNSAFIEWVDIGSLYIIKRCADNGESIIVIKDTTWYKV